MNLSCHILTSLFILVVSSCEYLPGRIELERIHLEEIPEQTVTIDSLVRLPDRTPPEIHIINDSLLLITDIQDASHLRIFNVNKKELKDYNLKSKKDSIRISDDENLADSLHFLNKANRVYYDMEIKNGIMRIKDFHRLRIGERSPKEAVKADEKTYIGLGTYKDGLFSSFNTETRIMNYYGTYPLNHERYLYKEFIPYFEGTLAMKNKQVIYSSRNFGYISSYQYEEGKLRKVWEKQITNFLFTQHNLTLNFEDDHRYGFQGVDIQEKQIYALYNGDSKNDSRDFKNSVLVFNRNGESVIHYLFSDMIEYIAIDKQEKYIYGTFTPFMHETWLVRFQMSPH